MDNLLTNKYFCIAIIIAFIIVIYLYVQKKSCDVEPMMNLDLTPLPHELTETPWSNQTSNGDKHKRINNHFDKLADKYSHLKLKKNGYATNSHIGRADDSYRQYMEYNPNEDQPCVYEETGAHSEKTESTEEKIKRYARKLKKLMKSKKIEKN